MRLVALTTAAALLGPPGCGADGGPASVDPVPKDSPTEEPTSDAPMNDVANADAPPGTPPDTLLASLRVETARSGVDEPLIVRVEARNPSNEELALLTWNTPFEPTLSADAFAIARDGEPVPYRGRLVKRAWPPPDDAIVRLAPGETFERELDLSRHYAVYEPGTYSIALAPRAVGIDAGATGEHAFAALAATGEEPVVVERY